MTTYGRLSVLQRFNREEKELKDGETLLSSYHSLTTPTATQTLSRGL